MSNPFVGEIRAWACNFAPRGWAECTGQLLSIAQNTALFSILGTTYGGNGTTNFALPNLQGRTMVNKGQGAGLSVYDLGEITGTESVTLISNQMPQHNHGLTTKNQAGNPLGALFAAPAANLYLDRLTVVRVPGENPVNAQLWNNPPLANPVQLNSATVGIQGQSQPHENRQPYNTLIWAIALQGVFPARN